MDTLLQNDLFRQLDATCLERLRPQLRPVTLQSEEILYRAGERISHMYFPATAVLCMLTIMEDGRTVEAATVGREGASWVSASYGAPTMPCQTTVAIAGCAFMIAARYVEDEIQQNGAFHNVLTEYAHALLISSFRTGACNALHSLKQRCARWMLTTLDRTSAPEFSITHMFLSSLLGCNRGVLTTILGELEEAGGIQTRRGRIEIVNRLPLESSSCECYQVSGRLSCISRKTSRAHSKLTETKDEFQLGLDESAYTYSSPMHAREQAIWKRDLSYVTR